MLLEKGQSAAVLPCAGITLIRFTGIISDCCQTSRRALRQVGSNTPGTLKTLKLSY